MAAGAHVELIGRRDAAQLGPDPDHPYRQPAAAARADPALCAARARDAVDEAEIDRAGREPCRIVGKQREAGIDVGNNGEQQRDSFFLYLKARLSGLGGSWERPSRADVDRYPEFKRMWTEQHASQDPGLGARRAAEGDRRGRYLDDRAIDEECRYFRAVLDDSPVPSSSRS